VHDEHLTQLEREVNRLESGLSALRESYKETHPDVQRTIALLAAKKKERDQYEAKLASMKPSRGLLAAAARQSGAPSREIQGRIAALQAAVQAKIWRLRI